MVFAISGDSNVEIMSSKEFKPIFKPGRIIDQVFQIHIWFKSFHPPRDIVLMRTRFIFEVLKQLPFSGQKPPRLNCH